MAIALIHQDNSIFLISENIEKLKLQYQPYGLYENNHAGTMINISQEEFDSLQDGSKNGKYNGTSLVLENTNLIIFDKNFMDIQVNHMLSVIDLHYKKHKANAWGAELNAYKTILSNLDTSSISYPYNGTLESYLKSQGNSIISTLQIR